MGGRSPGIQKAPSVLSCRSPTSGEFHSRGYGAPGVLNTFSDSYSVVLDKFLIPESQKFSIKQQVLENNHDIFVASMEELDAFINYHKDKISEGSFSAWGLVRENALFVASWTPSAKDVDLIYQIYDELGFKNMFKAQIKSFDGKAHVIFKGNQRLRKFITGTRYSVNNVKMVQFAIGNASTIKSVLKGGILSIYFMTAFRVADYWLRDEATMTELIGSLAVDFVKVFIAVGASAIAASVTAFTSALLMTSVVAVGPIVAAVLVGIAATYLLNEYDEKHKITQQVVAGLEAIQVSVAQSFGEAKSRVNQAVKEMFDQVLEASAEAALNFAKNRIHLNIKDVLRRSSGGF